MTKKKYKDSIPSRFFLSNNPSFSSGGYWFHACSYGEMKSLLPLVKRFEDNRVSVITNTGFELAKKVAKEARFLPFEIFLPLWMRNHKTLIVTEAEIWYGLFFYAKARGMKTVLINARISDRSYPRYKRFAFFYKKVFACVDVVLAQSELDAKRLRTLGAKDIKVLGNIKTLSEPIVTQQFKKPLKPIFTLASTHEGEEEIVLDSIKDFQNKCVVIVPRHPERFEIVHQILQRFAKNNGLSYHRFSQKDDFESNIVLVDTMGDLVNIYAISSVVVLAGSFIKSAGGHNPLEPAFFGLPIISGPKYFNQKELYRVVENIHIAKDLEHLQALIENFQNLLSSKITHQCHIETIVKEII